MSLRLQGQSVYLWQGVMDMRVSFDRLSKLVKEKLGKSVISSGGVFVFFSRCRARAKILYWDKDGYALWYKRLEAGSFKVEKKDEYEVVTSLELRELLSGIELSRIKLRKEAEKGSYD